MALSDLQTRRLRDAELPAVEDLLGSGVPMSLRVALESKGVQTVRAVAAQVIWRPGESITVRYSAELDGRLQGRHQVVVTSGRVPDGGITVETEEARVGVWVLPQDPVLVGLASALDPQTVRRLLYDLGAPAAEEPAIRLRAYRPGRRAVVEVADGTDSIFLKVLPPCQVRRLHLVHTNLADHLPFPRSLGYDEELGLLAMQTLPGITFRRALESGAEPLPPVEAFDQILQSLPDEAAIHPSKSAVDRLEQTAGLLLHLVPEEEDRLVRLTEEIGQDHNARKIAVHGDFYESQVLVSGGQVSGVLDIDTFGRGRPGEDQATMIGHLSLWQQLSLRPERTRVIGKELLSRWERRFDPADLRRRAAAVVLSLATGPFRVQRSRWAEETKQRIRLAESWLWGTVPDERSLTAASSPTHRHPPAWSSSNHATTKGI